MKHPQPADPFPDALEELRPAVADVFYELTHGLSDTPEDLRDAAAFAPIGLVKALGGIADYLSARPKRTAATVGAALLAVGLLIAVRRVANALASGRRSVLALRGAARLALSSSE